MCELNVLKTYKYDCTWCDGEYTGNGYFAVFWGGITKSNTAKDENVNNISESSTSKEILLKNK